MFLKKYFILISRYKYLEEFIISFLFIILPATTFYVKNYIVSSWYIPLFLYYCYLLGSFLILTTTFILIKNKNKFFYLLIVFFSFLFFLQFQNLILFNFMNSFNYSVSYLYFIIIIFFLILTKFCYQVFKKFIIFFLLIILIGDGYSFFRSFVENFTYEEKIDLPNKNEVKNKRELDIIYIISDASLPFNRVFEKKKKFITSKSSKN